MNLKNERLTVNELVIVGSNVYVQMWVDFTKKVTTNVTERQLFLKKKSTEKETIVWKISFVNSLVAAFVDAPFLIVCVVTAADSFEFP